MNDFKNKVAVVTGGASGIGRAMADRFAREGMRIVLADVEQAVLDKTERVMSDAGADVIAVQCDVSKRDDVQALAQTTIDRFGGVHIVCNNAGVVAYKPSWELSLDDWRWVVGVNLMGVVYGVQAFVPLMLERGEEGHIVNTSSIAGLLANSGSAPYDTSKFGVVALSETLHHELRLAGGKIGVSVLCPGLVKTQILEADRNRPDGPLSDDALPTGMTREVMRTVMAMGIPPEKVADDVLEAIREGKMYILPHPEFAPLAQKRAEAIVAGGQPLTPGLP
jgi:NAD(P)-dependent dehydrogenase (short-subunit alcohol dehydrogenase family)